MATKSLHDKLMDEADRVQKIDPNAYHMRAHELRAAASDVSRAESLLKNSKEIKKKP